MKVGGMRANKKVMDHLFQVNYQLGMDFGNKEKDSTGSMKNNKNSYRMIFKKQKKEYE